MVSNWIDTLFVTRTKRNRFTVFSRKYLESLTSGRGLWSFIDRLLGATTSHISSGSLPSPRPVRVLIA